MRQKKAPSRLLFLGDAGKNKWGHHLGRYACVCGKRTIVRKLHVKYGLTRSCGCLQKESRFGRRRHYTKRAIADRFWEKVDKNGPVARHGLTPCWIWQGAISRGGYGVFMMRTIRGTRKNKLIIASRMAWLLMKGPIPYGKKVLHRCDVGACCRPSHLFIGTQRDNMHDMIAKGRCAPAERTRNVGSEHGRAKLVETDVMDIRGLLSIGAAKAALARKFNVSEATIYFIDRGVTWRHVKGKRNFKHASADGLRARDKAAAWRSKDQKAPPVGASPSSGAGRSQLHHQALEQKLRIS